MSALITGLILLCLICASAFFSSSETAFLSISKVTLRNLLKEKKRNAHVIEKLKSNNSTLLTTILIGNNLVNSFSSSIAAAFAISLFGEAGVGIATAVMTVVVITFGETVPKTLAAHRAVATAQQNAPVLRLIQIMLFPFVKAFSALSVLASKTAHKFWHSNTPIITEEELKTLIELGNQEGTVENREKEMLYKIFEFSDLRVKDIMKNRTLIKSISLNATYSESIKAFETYRFSRLPVYDETTLLPCGMLHYKDILFNQTQKEFSISSIMRPVLLVPESKSAVSLLQEFRQKKQNIALAVDEHGSTCGIVSMDDLLKAVLGQMRDEYDYGEIPSENRIKILKQNEFLVPANLKISDVNDFFNVHLYSENYRTLAGWLLEQFDAMPSTGEYIRHENALFTIEEKTPRKINLVKIKIV